MIVLITGGHLYQNRARVYEVMDGLFLDEDDLVIHGDAPGADTFAKQWCRSRGLRDRAVPAKWDVYGPGAGPIRNTEMLASFRVDLCIAFPGARGTSDMVAKCRAAGIEVREIDGHEHPSLPF